jgi:hypothetical protein
MSYIELTKWPLLLVRGESVTPEQAAEVIIRTDGQYLSSNDRYWDEQVHEALGVPYWSYEKNQSDEERSTFWDDFSAAWKALGSLDLQYMTNSRLSTAYIYGEHGWMNWDGTVFTDNYNVGKWPEVADIQDELERIAVAFPFLKLRAQLIPNEGMGHSDERNEYGEVINGDQLPVVEFVVEDGKVELLSLPGKPLSAPGEGPNTEEVVALFWSRSERASVSIDYIESAAQRVREKIASEPKKKKSPRRSPRNKG